MNESVFNPELAFQEAMQAHQSGQFDKAENLLREVLQHMPDQDGIMTALGGVLLSSGKIEESVQLLERAIALNPDNLDAQLNLGIAYQNMGNLNKGLEIITAVAKKAPERPDIQYNFANVLLQAQRHEDAVEVLNQTIQTDPSFVPAYHTLGAIYNFQQKPTAAIGAYEQALVLAPNDFNTLIYLGNLLADIGQTDKAQSTYLRATTAYPNHFLPHAVLGKFYLDIGESHQGEASLLKAFALNPNDLNTSILLGNVNKTLGKIDEAEKFYRQALIIDPNDKGALGNLRRILSLKIPYWHFEMLADVERNDAYQEAIEKVITKESRVLDIGTGSGLLAMMAARAGAKSILACEMHQRLAITAKKITEANGFEEVITVFPDKSTKVRVGKSLPEKVDVIISEILDVGAIGEAALPSLRHAINNLAKPGAILIPSQVKLYGQIIEIPSRSLVAPIREISGFDLSLFEEYRIPNEYLKINLKAEKYKVLSPILPLMEIDFYNLPPAYSDDQPRQSLLNFEIAEEGIAQAIVFWFDLYLDDEIMVSSQVDGKLEHWGQALFCFPQPKAVEKGVSFPVTMLQSDQILRFAI